MPNRRSPEPLSRHALKVLRQYPTNLAETDALFGFMETMRTRRVYDQLKRYVHGEQDGTSILIAGSRGMGKTTMTKLVVQQLIARDDGMIPLPLVLHGPTLLSPEPEDTGAATPAGRLRPLELSVLEEREKEREKLRLKRWVLRGLMASLYRHVCTHIIEAWENAVVIEQKKRWRWFPRTRPLAELEQLRGHLDLRLDEAPDVAALRKIWRRAGFLRRGVLPNLYPCGEPPHGNRKWPRDQGVREIVALAACATSYLTILGSPEETMATSSRRESGTRVQGETAGSPDKAAAPGKSDDNKDKPLSDASGTSRKEQVQRILPPALATVATTAIGVAHPTDYAIPAILAGAAVYFASWLSSNFSLRHDALSELRRELTVRVDWTERRLEREVPVLLSRVKRAGLAPIFIIDELDKLPHGEQPLHDFIDFSKHLVREHAAFLFLTHRDYFERLVPRAGDIPGGQ
jgi:hypothetical protein